MQELDQTVALDGIDGVFGGPSDLASVRGHVGNSDHSDVQAAIRDIVRRAQAQGCPLATLA